MQFDKKFENDTKKVMSRLCPDHLGELHRLPDGLAPIKDYKSGGYTYRHVHKMPGDFMSWRAKDGKLVLVECKTITSGMSLSIEDDNTVLRQKQGQLKTKGTGLKNHQLHSLLNVWEADGVAMLIVAFKKTNEVFLANGTTLLVWLKQGDAKGNNCSMSLEHLDTYGYKLGSVMRWAVEPHHLSCRTEQVVNPFST